MSTNLETLANSETYITSLRWLTTAWQVAFLAPKTPNRSSTLTTRINQTLNRVNLDDLNGLIVMWISSKRGRVKFGEKIAKRRTSPKPACFWAQIAVRLPGTSEPIYADGLKSPLNMEKLKKFSNITSRARRPDTLGTFGYPDKHAFSWQNCHNQKFLQIYQSRPMSAHRFYDPNVTVLLLVPS